MIMNNLASGAGSGGGAGGVILVLFFVLLGLAFYFLPTGIAKLRHMPNVGGIFIINLLVGWTFIGWIVALVMACNNQQQQPVIAYPQYPYPPQGYQPGPYPPPPSSLPPDGQPVEGHEQPRPRGA